MTITQEEIQTIINHLEMVNSCENLSERKKSLELILKTEPITEEERVAIHEWRSSDGKSLIISVATLHSLKNNPELETEIKRQAELSLLELTEVEAIEISEPTPEALASYMSFVAAYLVEMTKTINPAFVEGMIKGAASISIKNATYEAALIEGITRAVIGSAGVIIGKYLIDRVGQEYADIIKASIKGFSKGLMAGGLATAVATSAVAGAATAVTSKKSDIPDVTIAATIALIASGSIVQALYSGGERYAYNKIYAAKDGRIQLQERRLLKFFESRFVAKKISKELKNIVEGAGNATISRLGMYYAPPARSSSLSERVMVTDSITKISNFAPVSQVRPLNVSNVNNFLEMLPNDQQSSIQAAKPMVKVGVTHPNASDAALIGAFLTPVARFIVKKLNNPLRK